MSKGTGKHDGQPPRVDLIVRNGYVITMDDANRILEDGAIAVDRGRIVAVGDSQSIASKYRANRIIDAKGAPVHPGFVECHMHASFQ